MPLFFTKQIHSFCFFLDNIVYSLIEKIYELLIYLANVDLITNNEVLKAIIQRIYLLLGIFMLFKVAFSILQYIVSPDSFTDSSKGFGRLVTNALVTICLLVFVPYLFNVAYKLQGVIIGSNVIPTLIFGEHFDTNSSVRVGDIFKRDDASGTISFYDSTNEDKNLSNEVRSMARDVEFAMFGAFFHINTDDDTQGFPACAPGKDGNGPNSDVLGSRDLAASSCFDSFVDEMHNESKKQNGALIQDFYKYKDGDNIVDKREFSSFGDLIHWTKDDKHFVISYKPLVSTLVGGYLVFLLISFCIEIAARAIKLMFLQAVAPIAIVSYIDPKESLSNGKLKNWVSETFSTYISLFIRLAVVFLAIVLVEMMSSMMNATTLSAYSDMNVPSGFKMIIYVFLVLGIFSFAKQVPKMIEKIFGIDFTGQLQLNPIKALGENAGVKYGVSGAVGGTVGALTGGISRSVSAVNTHRGLGHGPLKTITGGIGGALGGVVSGAAVGAKGGYKGAAGRGARLGGKTTQNIRNRDAAPFFSRTGAKIQIAAGGPMPAEAYQQKIERYQSFIDNKDKLKTNLKTWAERTNDYKLKEAKLTYLEHNGGSADDIKQARKDLEDTKKAQMSTRFKQIVNGTAEDANSADFKQAKALIDDTKRMQAKYSKMDKTLKTDYEIDSDWSSFNNYGKSIETAKAGIEHSDAYKKATTMQDVAKDSGWSNLFGGK